MSGVRRSPFAARHWTLDRTSSSLNFFLDRDHAHVEPPPAKHFSKAET